MNTAKLLALADHIERGRHPFSYDLEECFLGQLGDMEGTLVWDTDDLARRLGLPHHTAQRLCVGWPTRLDNTFWGMSRQQAAWTLRHLARTGDLRWAPPNCIMRLQRWLRQRRSEARPVGVEA